MKRKDIPNVSKLLVNSYKKEEKTRRWKETLATEYVLMLYRMCKDFCFIVIEKDKVIGAGLSVIIPEFDKQILKSKILLVHPDYRRKKIATKLIRKTCAKADNKYGIKEIETSIYTLTNFPITWYESIGFRTRKNFEVTRANIMKVLSII